MTQEYMDIELPEARKGSDSLAEKLLKEKYKEYLASSRLHKGIYYLTRFIAGLSAGLLPFVVGTQPTAAKILSVLIVVAIVIDTVLDSKSKWALYSRATDLLAVAELKAKGEYEKYKESLEILLSTEQQALAGLKELEDILKKVKKPQEEDT